MTTQEELTAIFPGWGTTRILALQNLPVQREVAIIGDTARLAKHEHEHEQTATKKFKISEGDDKHGHEKLGVLYSISIAGLDLTGSCLYTAGVTTAYAGKFAPIALFAVSLMLFFFCRIYNEVVTAIPINGGTYSLMLQVAKKKTAGIVASLSILSYMATAIVSSFAAVVYLRLLWPDCEVRSTTVLILTFFCVLTCFGVRDSASVALSMFLLHMVTLTLLIAWGLAYGIQDNFETLHANWSTSLPTIVSTSGMPLARQSAIGSLFFGYSSGLLGITGFETASNYCENMQSSKTFVATVHWMWLIVGVYNPLLSLISLMVLPLDRIYEHSSDLLAEMAKESGEQAFYMFLTIDAVIILCGGVLTAMVGVSGLFTQLATDHIIPEVFAMTNCRGAPHYAIVVFTALAISLFLAIFDPANPTAINDFGGVFAISFLTVILAFIVAAMLLKQYRPWLARRVVSTWWEVMIGCTVVSAGFIGKCC